jgi:amidohydrolase
LHVDLGVETGKVGTRCGPFLAAADELFITIHGKGGHGAYAYKGIDPIVIAAQTVMALQTIVSRSVPPLHPAVVSIGHIEGIGNTNIIPDEVKMRGTIRTFNNEWRKTIHQRITSIVSHTAKSFGGHATIDIKRGYPPVHNNTPVTRRAIRLLEELLGKENIETSVMRMGADDFSFFSQKVPATYLRLGVRSKEMNTPALLHSAEFVLDEAAFETGMKVMCWLGIKGGGS